MYLPGLQNETPRTNEQIKPRHTTTAVRVTGPPLDPNAHPPTSPDPPSIDIAPRLARDMPQRVTFEYNPLSYAYPDDESDKELFLQASGTIASHLRAVLLYWANMVFSDGEEVWQVVRLDKRDNVYKYVYPDLIVVDGDEREDNQTFSLGVFSRDQREAVLEYAEDVEYEERSDEGQCLTWMSRLLERMIGEGLVGRGVVDAIRAGVPLP